MDLFADRYRVKPTRLNNWNYSTPGFYFITICTYNKNNFFGSIIDRKVYLSKRGDIAKTELLKTFEMRSNIVLDEYVIMPNHIHLIIQIKNNPVETHCMRLNLNKNINNQNKRDAYNASLHQIAIKSTQTIPRIIKLFKSSVKSKLNYQNLWFAWQTRFYDQIIRNEKQYLIIKQYITDNPANWENDSLFCK